MISWIKSLFSGRSSSEESTISSVTLPEKPVVDCDELMRQGYALQEAGKLENAKRIYEQILEYRATYTDALFCLGVVHGMQKNLLRAIELVEAAIKTNSGVAEFYRVLGKFYKEMNREQQAVTVFERALELEPEEVSTICAVARGYREIGQFEKSIEAYTKAFSLDPNLWPALYTRAEIYLHCGHIDKALADYELVSKNQALDAKSYSSYLFALSFTTSLSAAQVFDEHVRYDKLFGSGLYGEIEREITDSTPDRLLRVGYVSPDFNYHVVSIFIEPILQQHDRNKFEIFCYHINNVKDEKTVRLAELSDHWLDADAMTSEQIANKIIEDKIDILVDLAGHTSNNRLEIFARKPAPIQITWLGYISTTGLKAMDYRIVDQFSDPVGASERFHSEQLLRLPHTQWCFKNTTEGFEVSELPALKNGFITFGSFNRYSKISTKILNLWLRLLATIPNSHLVMIDVPDCELSNISNLFNAHHIDLSRVQFHGRTKYEVFRTLHQQVDIALDTHPYSGGTTTCESLWMGVPVLTLTGETSVSRSTSSLLQNLGLSDCIASNEEDYIQNAIKVTQNLTVMSELRRSLREKLGASPVMDSARFTRDLENAYREVWGKKCSESAT